MVVRVFVDTNVEASVLLVVPKKTSVEDLKSAWMGGRVGVKKRECVVSWTEGVDTCIECVDEGASG